MMQNGLNATDYGRPGPRMNFREEEKREKEKTDMAYAWMYSTDRAVVIAAVDSLIAREKQYANHSNPESIDAIILLAGLPLIPFIFPFIIIDLCQYLRRAFGWWKLRRFARTCQLPIISKERP